MPRRNPENVFESKVPIPLKGMNCVRPANEIAEDEARDIMNYWISPFGHFETRPGLTKLTESAISGKTIKAKTYHPASEKLIIVADNKVYSMPLAGGVPAEVGTTNMVSATDQVQTALFHGDVYIATGGALQRVRWDTGTSALVLETVTAQSFSLPAPDAAGSLIVRNSRLWVGERSGSMVWYSGTDDGLDWGRDPTAGTGEGETLNGGKIPIDADDGGYVAGFANFKDNLIIFKAGKRRSIHKIQSDPSDAASFARIQISEGISALSGNLVAHVDTDVLYCGTGGVYSLQVTDYVGSVASVPASLKVNSYYESGTPTAAAYSAELGMMFVALGGSNLLVYHRGAEAWFRWVFSLSGVVSSIASIEGNVYFGTTTGDIYLLDRATQADDENEFVASFVSRVSSFGGGIRMNWVDDLWFALQAFSAGAAFVDLRGEFGARYDGTVSVDSSDAYSSMWDTTQWDSPSSRWDAGGVLNFRVHVGKIEDNFQFAVTTTGGVRFLEMGANGAHLSRRRWEWHG